MENTARKLANSMELLADIKEAHGGLDLLKVFLITGATDISKSYELVKQWHRNAYSDADKANFDNALKVLQAIELKRIELTSIVYGIDIPIDTTPVMETHEDAVKVILMLPRLDEIQDKIRKAFKESTDIKETKQWAFEELKTSVGQGKASLGTDNVPITWDNDHINQFIETVAGTKTDEQTTVIPSTFGFKTIYEHVNDMVNLGKTEGEIKASLANLLIDKVITSGTDQFLVKGQKGFDDYYSRILSALVTSSIKTRTDKVNAVDKEAKAEEQIAAKVIPMLESLDKDEKQSSFVSITKAIRQIYNSLGFNKSLSDSLLKAQEVAETAAPNLLKRNKESKKADVPIVPQQTVPIPVQIYDDSHNIKESNKELWTEVEKYEYLQQLFDKGVELSKKGNWRDALSMCIILISSGKIKQDDTATTPLDWDVNQIHLWYHSNIEGAINASKDLIVDAEIVTDPTAVKVGPAVVAGTIDAKEMSTKLLKDTTLWDGIYKFKSFDVKTDRRQCPIMSFQILDVTSEQEKTLLVTESNMLKFFNDMRQHIVEKRNEQPWVKGEIFKQFSYFYDITGSEAKGITQKLVDEADAIRRANKAANKAVKADTPAVIPEVPITTPPVEPVTTVPEVIVPPVDIPDITPPIVTPPVVEEPNKESEVVVNPPVEPLVDAETELNPPGIETTTPTEESSKEDVTNSNRISYAGFEDVLKAHEKYSFHKAIYAKSCEYTNPEEAVQNIFMVINSARKDRNFKKFQVRNFKSSSEAEVLEAIKKIIAKGIEIAAEKKPQ